MNKQGFHNRKVFIFLESMPQRQGTGASLRFYSNIQAYLELGFDVEVIQIAPTDDRSEPSDDLKPVRWTRVIEPVKAPSLFGRLAYRMCFPTREAVRYMFPLLPVVRREAISRFRCFPMAVFHFDGESLAAAIPWLPRSMRSVWSLHDLPSVISLASTRIACEAAGRVPSVAEDREYQFFCKAERIMADSSRLVLCIGHHDAIRLKKEWGCAHAEYLPMSIPGDGAGDGSECGKFDGRLRLLHLGRISHLPSYRSLEFLLEQVFPKLPPELIDRVSLTVVGRVDDSERARRILALAGRYPNVSFEGYVDDIVPYYRSSDAQIVASTEAAGLRTRIVESFAFGLPVISTTVGAEGIGGWSPGKQLLIADTAEEFVRHLEHLTRSPDTLSRLAEEGRAFYARAQSRRSVAAALSSFLSEHLEIPS